MSILEPRQNWSIVPASQLAGVLEQRVLIVGQTIVSGTESLIQDHPNDNSENTLFGRRSHIAGLVRDFKKINGATQLDLLPLNDALDAVQATGVISITGTATENGTLYISVASEKNYTVQIDVLDEDTATDTGDSIESKFNALLDAPFTASNNAGEVTFTAENGGTLANDWCLKVVGAVAGISATITSWANGINDPTITSILDVIANIRYRTVVWPSVYSLETIEDLLNSRFNEEYKIMDGVVIQTKQGTLASIKSYADQNSQSVCILANKTVSETDRDGATVMEMADNVSAQFAAFRALKVEDNKSLTQYLSSVAAKDQFGGFELASLPYFNTLMPYLAVPDQRDEFSMEEQVELTDNGVSVFSANRAYNSTILGQVVTTYLTNPAGNEDDSYKYLEVVDTASTIREYYYENFRARYAQSRLTDGDLIPGRDIANEGSIRAFCNSLYSKLALATLVQDGSVAKKDFDDNLVIDVSVREGSVSVNMAPLLVTQLRVVLGTIRINFGS